MASPIKPTDLLKEIFFPTDSMCLSGKIRDYMDKVTAHIEYERRSDGTISDAFRDELCALECVSDDTDSCPDLVFNGTVTSLDEQCDLSWVVAFMEAGYAYSIYRTTTLYPVGHAQAGEPDWTAGAVINSGTTTGNTVTYSDLGLTNDTIYYYKLDVQKPGCELVSSAALEGTPGACQVLLLSLAATAQNNAVLLNVTSELATSGIPTGSTWKVCRAAGGAAIDLTTPIATGVIGDAQADCLDANGFNAFCYTDSGLTNNEAYRYSVIIQEKVGCTAYVYTTASSVTPLSPLAAPTLTCAFDTSFHYIVTFTPVAGAAYYNAYLQRVTTGESFLYGQLLSVKTVAERLASNDIGIPGGNPFGPCSAQPPPTNLSGGISVPAAIQKAVTLGYTTDAASQVWAVGSPWAVWLKAVDSNGIESVASNQIAFDPIDHSY